MYIIDERPLSYIAKKLNVSISTIWTFMRNYGIDVRSRSDANKISTNIPETKAKRIEAITGKPSGALGKNWKINDTTNYSRVGPDNNNWKGGVSSDPDHLRQQRTDHKAMRRGKTPHMPKWADKRKIEEIYKQARDMGLTVDHIIPLSHPRVTGLHCEENLRLLSREENSKKSNKFNN
ncbi:MAG: HNH endonuclease signature motif containing protein [Candidatus Omnitrophica bacterium]|nr:HNH endonuclease signature motif containing protein [Candidatus Omnitrophota bacterium]